VGLLGQLADKHHWPRGGGLLKFGVILKSFDIAESEYHNQTALSPITVVKKGLNSKTIFVIKK